MTGYTCARGGPASDYRLYKETPRKSNHSGLKVGEKGGKGGGLRVGSEGAGGLNRPARRGRKPQGGRGLWGPGRRKEGAGRGLRAEGGRGEGPGESPARSRPARTHSSPWRRPPSVMGRTTALGGSAPRPEGRKHRLSFSSKLRASAAKPSPAPPGPALAPGLALQFSGSWRVPAGSWNS